jgi:hypothetical protein
VEVIAPEHPQAVPGPLLQTRLTLTAWLRHPRQVLGPWFAGAAIAAALLLGGTLAVAELVPGTRLIDLNVPPVTAGGSSYVLTILGHNLLVLALHVMACVAGFIAGSSVPSTAEGLTGIRRRIHLHGARLAIGFVIVATAFSLGNQIWDLGTSAAGVGNELHVSPALLLLALLPHAGPELLALFLPLAAWVIARRRGTWDELLAAALLSTALAIPILIAAAVWESYGAPGVIVLVTGR